LKKFYTKKFRPEFLNRIDALVFFRQLTAHDVEKIAQLQLHELQERVAEKHITLHIDHDVVKKISELGYVKEFGARPLKRTIQKIITVPLSQHLLRHPEAKEINVRLKKNEIVIE
jgi:ATP-dependent Clp protease ATP-binding subunit ClpA